jgi:chorismate mutase/prephenate dehydratase
VQQLTMSEETRLQEIRERIDGLDERIQDLLSARAAAAKEVAEIKLTQDSDAEFYRPEREAQVLRQVKERNTGPLDGEVMARLFREIMSACLALEQPLRVAFLGPEGTFTQAAAVKHFGHAVTTVPVSAIPDVFRDVSSGSCQYGVVPVENSTEGVISHTLDMFMTSPLRICGEVTVRINQHLMGRVQALSEVRRVFSHQQSLAQCRAWLDRNLAHAERLPRGSNAEAARLARDDAASVAVAGEAAADIYGLDILVHNIEDEPNNTTRFLVIGRNDSAPSGRDKTSLLLSCRNQAGGLCGLLSPLSAHGISMTRIESRPSRTNLWEYVFFIDVEGHREDPQLAQAFQELEEEANLFRVLGSYPIAVL